MAFKLNCTIEIGNYKLYAVNEVRIDSSWRKDSEATILLPNRGVIRKQGSSNEPVRLDRILDTGQPVKIFLGYENKSIHLEFEGYISKIKVGYPLELHCEDEMYQLKRSKPISKSYGKITVKELLQELVPTVQLGANLPQITIDNFVVRNATAAQVLQELREKYGLAIYFRGKTLYAGLPYLEQNLQNLTTKFDTLKNVAEAQLEYVREKDVRMKVRAVSFLGNNEKIEATVGDADGEERTLHYYRVSNVNALKEIATADLKKYKYDGFKGTLTGFGIPFCVHSQALQITDSRYAERQQGVYLCESVKTVFGTSGFRRELEIGQKIR